jgi:hypothetical protein
MVVYWTTGGAACLSIQDVCRGAGAEVAGQEPRPRLSDAVTAVRLDDWIGRVARRLVGSPLRRRVPDSRRTTSN